MFIEARLLSAVPTADAFQTTVNGSELFITACFAVAGAIATYHLAKWLGAAKTFVGAIVALAAGGALMWGTNAIKGNTLDSTMTDTWKSVANSNSNPAPQATPAQKPKG